MAFLIGGANTLATGDFITNSLRLSHSDNGFLERTTSGVSDSNRKTWTFSWWAKLNATGLEQHLYGFRVNADNMSYLRLNTDGAMRFANEDYQQDALNVQTNRLFRDPSAWYHIVLRADTTQSTEADRIRFYINGVQETSMSATDYPSQNYDLEINQPDNFIIGAMRNTNGTTTGQVDGYLSEVHFVDGQSYAPTVFGEYNDNGVWIPKDCKDDITYGTRGFYMQFKGTGTSANSSGMGADTSGNDNHFTPNNLVAADITTDTPMNSFCTYNPLATPSSLSQYGTFSEGNTTYTGHSNGSYGSSATGTFGVASGKWYWESKLTTTLANGIGTGIRDISDWNPDWANDSTFNHTNAGGDGGYAYNYNNGKPQRDNAESTTNQGNAVSQNDIVMHAMDLDNGALYYGINGTWQASSDPTSGSSKTNAQHSFTVAGVYAPAAYSYSSKAFATNFGNAPFAISSGNSDANGYGNFEYAVPEGYYTLCTKNLAEYG